MLRYIVSLALYFVMLVVAILLAPLLPAFAVMRDGPADNGNKTEVGPRLPSCLFWFDTSTDNSLWGDTGWRTRHCPKGWSTWFGMVRWLWRNPAAGFCWSIISTPIYLSDIFELSSSGCGLDLDKGRCQQGWFMIRSNAGAFQFRWVKEWLGLQFSFEAGWLLDLYMKDRQAVHYEPTAIFAFEPQVRRVRKNAG